MTQSTPSEHNTREKLVKLRDIEVKIGEKRILTDINLDIEQQQILTLIGPNGAGKSTLVKLLAGLIAPNKGQIQRQEGLQIGYMPQRLRLDKSLPMKVMRFLSLAEKDKTQRKAVMAELGIDHLSAQQIHLLSGGELQRVLLARAILLKPQLLLLDEPLQGVDVNGQIELYRMIASLRDSLNCAVVMVSHDLHLVMAQTDSVICLNHHICCHGRPESVSQHPEYLRLFGTRAAEVAVYTHHHDHQHDLHGEVIEPGACKHD